MTDTIHDLLLKLKGCNFHGNLFTDASMKKRCTMRVGGIAPLIIEPSDVPSLLFALEAAEDAASLFVIGGGSNLIVSDKGFLSPVISTRALDAISHDGGNVTAGAGVPMPRLVEYCTEHSLSGLEQFAGLPGTAGGALYMNARCFDREISDVLSGADYVTKERSPRLIHYGMDKKDWAYKVSPFQGTERIITSAEFCLERGNKEDISEKCKGYIEAREAKGHFKAPSAGSVFRNNREFGKPSGVLIDEAGLKGFAIGGAQIAPWHANIIINTGNATARDIASLVKKAHDTVLQKTGFDLVCEVVFCGD